MFIPNWVDVYGSHFIKINDVQSHIIVDKKKRFSQTITIAKSGLKALDQPSDRCDGEASTPTTSSCITKFIEKKVGCSMNLYGYTNRELEDLESLMMTIKDCKCKSIVGSVVCLCLCRLQLRKSKNILKASADRYKCIHLLLKKIII